MPTGYPWRLAINLAGAVLPDLIKQLTESDLPRHHWRGDDERGGLWLFETVEGDGEHWAVRQVEIGRPTAPRPPLLVAASAGRARLPHRAGAWRSGS